MFGYLDNRLFLSFSEFLREFMWIIINVSDVFTLPEGAIE